MIQIFNIIIGPLILILPGFYFLNLFKVKMEDKIDLISFSYLISLSLLLLFIYISEILHILHISYRIIQIIYYYFIFYTLLILPILGQSIKAFFKVRDVAWFFHYIACLLTLSVYSYNFILQRFFRNK